MCVCARVERVCVSGHVCVCVDVCMYVCPRQKKKTNSNALGGELAQQDLDIDVCMHIPNQT